MSPERAREARGDYVELRAGCAGCPVQCEHMYVRRGRDRRTAAAGDTNRCGRSAPTAACPTSTRCSTRFAPATRTVSTRSRPAARSRSRWSAPSGGCCRGPRSARTCGSAMRRCCARRSTRSPSAGDSARCWGWACAPRPISSDRRRRPSRCTSRAWRCRVTSRARSRRTRWDSKRAPAGRATTGPRRTTWTCAIPPRRVRRKRGRRRRSRWKTTRSCGFARAVQVRARLFRGLLRRSERALFRGHRARRRRADVAAAAQRGWATKRRINARQGWDAAEDRLPERLFEPIADGPLAGTALDRGALAEAALHTKR